MEAPGDHRGIAGNVGHDQCSLGKEDDSIPVGLDHVRLVHTEHLDVGA